MATVGDLENAAPGSVTVIDIRKKPDENRIPGSKRYSAEEIAANPPFGHDEKVVLYCGSGNSCSRVAAELQARGFGGVEALEGGYAAWKDAGLPLEPVAGKESRP